MSSICQWPLLARTELQSGQTSIHQEGILESKIGNTIEQDENNYLKLSDLVCRVIVVWQCRLRNKQLKEVRLSNLMKEIRN